MPEKPLTIRIDEFKQQLVDVMNNAKLPAWLMIMLIDPYVKQLQALSEMELEEERENYNKSLAESQEEATENENSYGTCPLE